jgi:predicted Zn-dependent protease
MKSPKLWILALAAVLAPSLAVCAADTAKGGTADSSETKYHDGSINDLSAIGNRNVGCGRGVGNWYSIEKQIALGRGFADMVNRTAKMVQDPVVTEYVNRIGQNIVRNSDAQVPFTIQVIDSDEINAFALPGGFFFVNSGLILAADNESELAGVMAHEIAHVCACHAARGATRGELASLASIPLIFVGGGLGYAVSGIAGLSLPVAFLKFSRAFEAQADYLGVEYLYKSGYDPQSFVLFFEKIEVREKKKPGLLSKTFESHPPTPDRIEKTQEEIGHILPDRNQYLLDTSEFQSVKSRLAQLQNRRKVDDKDKKEPSPALRRGQPSGNTNDSDQNQKKDDDQPTLHRREN